MRTFIDGHAKAVFGDAITGSEVALDLQIALYVQGLQYYNSKSRRHGLPPLSSPATVIHEAAVGARLTIYHQRLREQLLTMRDERETAKRGQRLQRQREEQAAFLQMHDGLPKVLRPGSSVCAPLCMLVCVCVCTRVLYVCLLFVDL